jgi:predicted ATPase/class 3 adenylate cyclase
MYETSDTTPGKAFAPEAVVRAFMFTDVVGSSQLMERNEAGCKAALAQHDEILRNSASRHGGRELAEAGDGFLFTIENAPDAATAALELQREIAHAAWPEGIDGLQVRVALGWGEVTQLENGEFRGLILNRTARLVAAIHGGQTVCGRAFAEAAGDSIRKEELGWYLLRDLVEPEQLFQLSGSETSAHFPPLNATPVVPCNLPRSFNTFFDREAEVAHLCELLAPITAVTRIVTLTGPGGAGKTRLSLAAGEKLRAAYKDAVWLVQLADVNEPALIPIALRDALRLPTDSTGDPLEQVAAFLHTRPALLILDNFEQLLPDGADLLLRVWRSAPGLRLLVSSRVVLNLLGETEFPVGPLPVPEPASEEAGEYASVLLFADRARSVRPNFELTSRNTAAIAEISRLLEGMPLAIELAASRADVIAPAEMVGELERRLSFCSSQNPDLPARHRSLRAAIDWSYDFLPAALKRFFERLSVFRRGWMVEAASRVAHSDAVAEEAGQTRRALGELRASSLISAEEVDGRMRFHMLETVRQYAAEKLENDPDAGAVRLRHAQFFCEMAERAEAEVHTSSAGEWLDRLDVERENVRAALSYSSEADLLARLATALSPYWIARALVSEGRTWLRRCESLADAMSPRLRAGVLYCAGTLAAQQADWSDAQGSFSEALAQFRAAEDRQNVAALLCNLGIVAAHQHDLAGARRFFEEALEQYALLDHPTREALALVNLGTVLVDLGENDAAAKAYQRVLELSDSTADEGTRALALHGIAQSEFHAANLARARTLAQESFALNRNLKLQPRLAENALLLACCSEDAAEAARWLAAADWLMRDTGALSSLRLNAAVDELRARLSREFSAADSAREVSAGRRNARLWCGVVS